MESGVVFNHNGNYEGDILISAPDAHEPSKRQTIRIDLEDLKSYVAAWYRNKLTEKLEQIEDNELIAHMLFEHEN